jgi:hypothetical protein
MHAVILANGTTRRKSPSRETGENLLVSSRIVIRHCTYASRTVDRPRLEHHGAINSRSLIY